MTKQEREIIIHYVKRIRRILTDFEKYRISNEEAVVGIRSILRYLEKYTDEEYLEGE